MLALVIATGVLLLLTRQTKTQTKPASQPSSYNYTKPKQLAILKNRRIGESSGLAAGRLNGGVFWTHNDSGGGAEIFATDKNGENLATFRISGARTVDWEDIASVTIDRKHYLVIADTGDNNRRRKQCSIYIIEEPLLNPDKKNVLGKLGVIKQINFTYPEGPTDCEAIGIDPTDGSIILVTKVLGFNCKIFTLIWPKSKLQQQEAKLISNLIITPVVAMDISADGRRAVLATYGPAFEYIRQDSETWADTFKRQGKKVTLPQRIQGESICYDREGLDLYLTSEKIPTPLWIVPAKINKQ